AGSYAVTVDVDDAVGNDATQVTATVIIDTTVPANDGVISINDAAPLTNTTAVNIKVTTAPTEANTRYKVGFSETNDSATVATWNNYVFNTNIPFTLSTGDGVKTVYAFFKDKAGNVSTAGVSDTITLDTDAPALFTGVAADGGAPGLDTGDTLALTFD
ncbi:MAG: hypothetical protein Q8P22_10400, partial [Chloroflexota bacterium]|nr:hypothetical protein [Chloroflexota bacterium]